MCAAGDFRVRAVLLGQTAPARPEFEVASVKPAEKIDATTGAPIHIGVQIDGAQVHFNSMSLKDLIRIAYRVKDYQVSGPDWITSERYSVHATLPKGAKREQVTDMLQSLLEERFQLKFHRDSKEFPVYAVVDAKNGKLKESPLDPDTADAGGGRGAVNVEATGGRNGVSLSYGRGAYFNFGNEKLEVKKLTTLQLADTLSRFVERPVIDMSGLTGTYDITLEFSPEDYRALLIRSALSAGVTLPPEALRLLEGANDETLFRGLQNAGLKLEPRKAPLEVLIVDSANRQPTDN